MQLTQSKPKRKTEGELALRALATTLKALAALAAFLVAYLADWHGSLLILAAAALLYLAFAVLDQKSLPTLLKYYRRANKFNAIHDFPEEAKPTDTSLPLREAFAGEAIRRRKNHQKVERGEDREPAAERNRSMPVYMPSEVGEERYSFAPPASKSAIEIEAQRRDYDKYYLQVREEYKRCFEDICGVEEKREEFEAVIPKIRSFYTKRVHELLFMNQQNLKLIKEELEMHYQVKVLEHQQEEKALEAVNLTFDQAITRLNAFQDTNCFPWTRRADRDREELNKHHERLEKIIRDRKEIDRFLAPYHPLTQKTREQAVDRLHHQLTHPMNLGRELAHTVAEIFNDKLKAQPRQQQYCIFKEGFESGHCLEMAEISMGERLHVDLLLKRGNREQRVVCNPGDNNLWTLIAFAIEVIRRKL